MDQHVSRTELSPVSFLRRSAFVYPHKVAVIHGDRSYTYGEFEQRVNRLASGLRAAGLKRQDRVAFLALNTPHLLEAHFGVPLAGGMLVAINTRLHSTEVSYILKHSGARILFVDETLKPLLAESDLSAMTVISIADDNSPSDEYEQFLRNGEPEMALEIGDECQPISINYTSGTTGQPKGVVYSHRGAYLNALGTSVEVGLSNETVFLWTLPMFHCNGWCFTWAVTAVGGTHVCLRRFDPDVVWGYLVEHGVTHFNGAPTVHTMLANSPRAQRLTNRVAVTMGGAPPSPTLVEQLGRLNMRPVHVYGLTETYGPITICETQAHWKDCSPTERAELLARQGQAYVTADLVRVVDMEMNDVPQDGKTMGEVVMRGNNVMLGYYDQPDATAEAFRGGWFHSGDLAVWHPDGNIELRDRKKDIIISGGENISTIEVEKTILRHSSVLECAVVSCPDDKWGERPKAFVTLKSGEDASEAELLAFCREHLASFKCPVAVVLGPLPKTSTGKVQKFVLRDREWQGRDKRISG